MFYFPRRPIPRRDHYKRRSWEDSVPYSDEFACHYSGDHVYADVDMLVPCNTSEQIIAAMDQSPYGRHAFRVGTTYSHTLAIDNGFPAIHSTTSWIDGSSRPLCTNDSFMMAMQIVVTRHPNPTWLVNSGWLGRNYAFAYGQTPQLTGSGTGWINANTSPITVQRRNGAAMTIEAALGEINTPMVLVMGNQSPSHVNQCLVGSASANYGSIMYIYEAIAFSSIISTQMIEEIEAYLMDKYGIIA